MNSTSTSAGAALSRIRQGRHRRSGSNSRYLSTRKVPAAEDVNGPEVATDSSYGGEERRSGCPGTNAKLEDLRTRITNDGFVKGRQVVDDVRPLRSTSLVLGLQSGCGIVRAGCQSSLRAGVCSSGGQEVRGFSLTEFRGVRARFARLLECDAQRLMCVRRWIREQRIRYDEAQTTVPDHFQYPRRDVQLLRNCFRTSLPVWSNRRLGQPVVVLDAAWSANILRVSAYVVHLPMGI